MIRIDFNPFRTDTAGQVAAAIAARSTAQFLELVPSESGKTWKTKDVLVVVWRGKTLTVPLGFEHDRYTFAPDLPDVVPCVAHDFACKVKKWDDGTALSRYDANRMFRDMMKASPDPRTRSWAKPYFFGVEVHRIFRFLTFRD